MKLRLAIFLISITCLAAQSKPIPQSIPQSPKTIIAQSRQESLEITSASGNSKGTGFIIGKKHVATCFHVTARIYQDGTNIKWDIFPDIEVTAITGLKLSAKVVSIPTQQSPEPLFKDFAILELSDELPENLAGAALKIIEPKFEIGDEVFFSGYPLATPAMVSHRGMISGHNARSDVICIQSSINKGNSGGALCNEAGQVIGIVSMREGGIAVGLTQLNAFIEESGKHGRVTLMGVDPLQTLKAISETLDRYISTGIGYAHSTATLRQYLDAHPNLLK